MGGQTLHRKLRIEATRTLLKKPEVNSDAPKEHKNRFPRLLVKLMGYICITILHPKHNGCYG